MKKFSTYYLIKLAITIVLIVVTTVILTTLFTVRLTESNPDTNRVIIGGIFMGVVSGIGLLVIFAPLYLRLLSGLAQHLDCEIEGMRMPISNEMLSQIIYRDEEEPGFQKRVQTILDNEWLSAVQQVREELEKPAE